MAGIVFGCVMPHPPLLISDIGRGQEQAIIATIKALDKLAQELADQRPELALLVSPHGHAPYDAMGVLTAPACRGDLRTWGSREPEYRFDNDLNFVQLLQEEAQNSGIPLKSIGEKHYELDHGALVPLRHLKKAVKDIPLVPLTFSCLPLASHFGFGQVIGRAAQRSGKRVVFIASGDLSHKLIPSAPAGYSLQGKVFDEKLVTALCQFDTETVLNLDPDLIDEAGECGLRSIVIMLGALEGLQVKPEVFSYQGPFGVGYLVASFTVQAASAVKKKADPEKAEIVSEAPQKAQEIVVEAQKKAELDGAKIVREAEQKAQQIIIEAQKKYEESEIVRVAEQKAWQIFIDARKKSQESETARLAELEAAETARLAAQKAEQIIIEAQTKAELEASETAGEAEQKAELEAAETAREAAQKAEQIIIEAQKKAELEAAETARLAAQKAEQIIIEAQKKAEFKPPEDQIRRRLGDIPASEPREVRLGSLSVGERFVLRGETFEIEGFRGNDTVKAILLKQMKQTWQRIAQVDIPGYVRVTKV